ncbi:MAG: TolC family protein [Planctomycetes bacterium]|nr:TolC family protein [Planctomycetota bacterium]
MRSSIFGFIVATLVLSSAAFGAEKKEELVKSVEVKVPEKTAEATPAAGPVATVQDNTLESLVAEALRNNSQLKGMRGETEEQFGKKHYEQRDWFPKLESYFTYDTQPDAKGNKNPARQSDRTWRKAWGVRAEQTIWDFGETKGKVHKEHFSAVAKEQKEKVKESEVAYDVAEAYWRVMFFEQVVSLRQNALQAKKKEVGSIADRVKANNATKAELKSAEARQAEAELDLLEANNGLKFSKQRLLFAIGRDIEGDIDVKGTMSFDKPDTRENYNAETHPDLKSVRAAEEAADAGISAAKAARLPKISFRGYIEDSTPEPGSGAGNLAPDGYLYQAGVFVRLPIGSTWVGATGRLKEAEGSKSRYAAEAEALKGSIKLNVANARNNIEEAIKGYEVSEKRKDASNENLGRIKQMLEAKNATMADVAKAEDDFAISEIGRLKAIYNVKVAEAELLREMGLVSGK